MAKMRNIFVGSVASVLILSACSETDETIIKEVEAAAAEPTNSPVQMHSAVTEDTGKVHSDPVKQAQLETAMKSLHDKNAKPDRAGIIESYATTPYTRDQYPKTFTKYKSKVPLLEKDRKAAAQIASKDEHCDGVIDVQITSSSPLENRHYRAECHNLSRYYFDEKSIASGGYVKMQRSVDFPKEGLFDW